jgi:hypothetical protein
MGEQIIGLEVRFGFTSIRLLGQLTKLFVSSFQAKLLGGCEYIIALLLVLHQVCIDMTSHEVLQLMRKCMELFFNLGMTTDTLPFPGPNTVHRVILTSGLPSSVTNLGHGRILAGGLPASSSTRIQTHQEISATSGNSNVSLPTRYILR